MDTIIAAEQGEDNALRIAQPKPVPHDGQPLNTTRLQNTNALATEWVVVSEWAPMPGREKTTGGLCYEDYTDQRKAEEAYHDYVKGEYSRARAVCIFASRHGVPIGRIA